MFLILVLASILRLWDLGQNPVSLYWEEAALGYDAYSIWETGKDHHGNPWPVVAFESFGDYKPSGYFYAAAPFVGILGLTETAVRLPSALAGIAAVALLYMLGNQLQGRRTGLLAALFLAIMPWHVHISRAAFEVNLAMTLMLAGIVLFVQAYKSKQWLFLPAAAMLAASMYTYHSLRVLVPLLILGLVGLVGKKIFRSGRAWLGGGLLILLLLPLLVNIRNPEVSKRFQETSFLAYSPAVTTTNQLRQQFGNTLVARVVFHRYWFWGGEVLYRMSTHLKPDFLFWHGDGNLRHQTDRWGLMYPWMTVPLLAGLAGIWDKKYRKYCLFLFFWLAAASFPSALTFDAPHTLRFLPALPAFILLAASGGIYIYDRLKYRKAVVMGALVAAALSLTAYSYDYLKDYPLRSHREWQYGYKQLVEYVKELPNDQTVLITRHYGRPAMYFMFYQKLDPNIIQKNDSTTPKDQQELLSVNHYFFDSSLVPKPDVVVSQNINNMKLLNTIKDLSSTPVFYIYDN